MRHFPLAIALACLASPAAAAPAPEDVRIPPELTDPKLAERLSKMSDAMTKALMDLPVGEIEAAAEGRPATDADRRRTVRDLTGPSAPDLERKIAESGPRIRAAMKAFSDALPEMTEALSKAADAMERATANMPQPGYPRR